MPFNNQTKSKKAYLVSLKHKLKKHLQLQSASANQVDLRWLNGFMAAGFHSGVISLSELKLECIKAHRNAYGERMLEAQEQQLDRRLSKLSEMNLYGPLRRSRKEHRAIFGCHQRTSRWQPAYG